MALDGLKKGCTDTVRVAIVVLQGLVIILAGLKIVRDNRTPRATVSVLEPTGPDSVSP